MTIARGLPTTKQETTKDMIALPSSSARIVTTLPHLTGCYLIYEIVRAFLIKLEKNRSHQGRWFRRDLMEGAVAS